MQMLCICPCSPTAPHCSRYPSPTRRLQNSRTGLFCLTPSAPLGFKSPLIYKKVQHKLHPFVWSWWRDLNPRPTDYESVALPLRHTSIKRRYYTLTNEICQEVLAFLHVPSRSFHRVCSCCSQLKLAFSTNVCYTV